MNRGAAVLDQVVANSTVSLGVWRRGQSTVARTGPNKSQKGQQLQDCCLMGSVSRHRPGWWLRRTQSQTKRTSPYRWPCGTHYFTHQSGFIDHLRTQVERAPATNTTVTITIHHNCLSHPVSVGEEKPGFSKPLTPGTTLPLAPICVFLSLSPSPSTAPKTSPV